MMDGIEIRAHPRGGVPDASSRCPALAFGEEYTEEDEDAYRSAFPVRPRRSARSKTAGWWPPRPCYSLELTVPGEVAIPMGGVTWIATLPTHRRRGLLRRLMAGPVRRHGRAGRARLGAGRLRGQHLRPFRLRTGHQRHELQRGAGARRLRAPPVDADAGRFTLLDAERGRRRSCRPSTRTSGSASRARSAARPAGGTHYLADPPQRAGGRHPHVPRRCTRPPPGVADGYVSYRVKEEWEGATARNERPGRRAAGRRPRRLQGAVATTCSNTDLCHTVSCWRGRVDEPLRWLLADPAGSRSTRSADFLWLRLLDVPRALWRRARYAAAGRAGPRGHRRLPHAQRQTATCCAPSRPARPAPSAAAPRRRARPRPRDRHAGAPPTWEASAFATLAAAGRVRELTPGAVARADAMFSTGTAPFCVDRVLGAAVSDHDHGHRHAGDTPHRLQRLNDPRRLETQVSEHDLARLLALRGDEDVLDLGSGTGFYTDRIAALTTGTVYAVELQPEMNDHYRERGVPANVRLVHGDITALVSSAGAARSPAERGRRLHHRHLARDRRAGSTCRAGAGPAARGQADRDRLAQGPRVVGGRAAARHPLHQGRGGGSARLLLRRDHSRGPRPLHVRRGRRRALPLSAPRPLVLVARGRPPAPASAGRGGASPPAASRRSAPGPRPGPAPAPRSGLRAPDSANRSTAASRLASCVRCRCETTRRTPSRLIRPARRSRSSSRCCVREAGRRLDVAQQGHPGAHLVDVLAAGPAAARGGEGQLPSGISRPSSRRPSAAPRPGRSLVLLGPQDAVPGDGLHAVGLAVGQRLVRLRARLEPHVVDARPRPPL